MYTYYHSILPTPLNELFIPNNTHYTRQHLYLHTNIGSTENVYRII